jgi:hypothetical protein
MTTLHLYRIEQNDFATYGQLLDGENRQLAVTLELPDRENVHDESCILAGEYTARRFHSPKRGYDVFMLDDVPGRAAIELHIGNLPHDTDGCILLGSNYTPVNGQPGIGGSQRAFARFMDTMRGIDVFTLAIIDPPATS